MNRVYVLIWSVLSIVLIVGISCKKADASIAVSAAEPDTRELVKKAYASIDPLNFPVSFNNERAELIRKKMEAEPDPIRRINIQLQYALELLQAGNSAASLKQYEEVFKAIIKYKVPLDDATKRKLYFMVGMAYMRIGEVENCVQNHNHQSCFIPIKGEGVHQLTFGSKKAITQFEALLKQYPGDLESKYLLNLAYMTLGEYPDQVPEAWRIDPSWYTNKVKVKPFKDIAPQLGLNRNGLAGSVVMDDFTNDGWLDLVMTSWNHDDPTLFYVNNGDGTFTDRSEESGISSHLGSLHLNQADFNNDGWMDLYIMRGAWYIKQGDIPNTLLMNTGKGTFVDVTLKAGLTHDAPTQAGAWADFNLDGWLDLVVANESFQDYLRGIDLYINQHDGTFTHESAAYGLNQNEFFKGCVATDVNNDRYPDIYFSSLTNGNLLLINQGASGQKAFLPVAASATVKPPMASFPCWNFDYNNDGNEDLFVSAFSNDGSPSIMWINSMEGHPDPAFLPKLYKNKGNMVFEDVSKKVGLNEVAFTMGCNFGDINTDGFLDFYLATGNPLYQSIVPNKMYLNMEGERFEDVSYSGFANIQKGHGVSFGDWDHDGDEDIYIVIGGAYDGDKFYNCFFENPNENNNNWVVLKLEGTTANKAAIGARVAISVQEGGKERSIYRTVNSGASFGANSLVLEVGLRKATTINKVTVQWPCKDCPEQVYTGLAINKAYGLIQDTAAPKQLEYNSVKPGTVSGTDHHMHH